MRNRGTKSEKRKIDSSEESSEEDGSTNGESSNPILIDDDNSNSGSHITVSSGTEDGSSSDISSDVQPKAKKRKLILQNVLLSDSSDSGDESCEKCAICLRSIINQEVGSPEGCDHLFCSVCIIEWSKNSNVCPLDRQQFSIILVRKSKNGNIVKQVPVEEPKALPIYEEDEDDTYCEICNESDREETMLLCDGCQRGFHIECLTPPLEEVPAEEEWFCPSCLASEEHSDILHNINEEIHSLVRHPRLRSSRERSRTGTRIRTLLLERIRVAVNRIVRSCFLDPDDDEDEDDDDDNDDDFEMDESESEEESSSENSVLSDSQPGTSGMQRRVKKTSSTSKKTRTKSKKRSSRKGTTKRKTTRKSRKRKTAGKKRRTKGKATIRTKSVKIKNADGSIKIVKTRTYKRRRKQKVKKQVKTAASVRKSSTVKSTPKTVKGRLALTLGMVPSKKPGQLLPDVRVKSSSNELSGIDINRARAGIPRLHIFEPRHELQLYSSGSDGEGYAGDDHGPIATLTQPRITVSSVRDRKRAALLLQSSSTVTVRGKPILDDPPKEIDILGSILDSQAIWHSKNTDVKINHDGSIQVLKKTQKSDPNTTNSESKNAVDVKGTTTEGITTQAPMYPGSSSRPAGVRPYNRNTFGESRGGQDGPLSTRGSAGQSGTGFNRFGSTPRNDREGYANYLNNMPQGPTPFCRGGPPLRFRMPSRQQLRRIPFPPRVNRSPWQNDEEVENDAKNKDKPENNPDEGKKADDEDIDLYSDIETNPEKEGSAEEEVGCGPSYPALGPPPEPSAFLLGIDENGEVAGEKSKSEVYDPAEPCDSEDEMVIDEHTEKPSTPEEKESQQSKSVENVTSEVVRSSEEKSPKTSSIQVGSTEDEDEECPIFTIYSSTSREFSQKEEEEREREIAEEKRRLEEMELMDKKSRVGNEVIEEERVENIKKVKYTDVENNTSLRTVGAGNDLREKGGTEKGAKDALRNEGPGVKDRSGRSEQRPDISETPLEEQGRSPFGTNSTLAESRSSESEKVELDKTPSSARDKSSSEERSPEAAIRRQSQICDYDSDMESKKVRSDEDDKGKVLEVEDKPESENESLQTKVTTGLEGLDVEEVSSDNGDGDEFIERSLSSLSLSELSNRSKDSLSRLKKKKKKRRRKGFRKGDKKHEDADPDGSAKEKEKSDDGDKIDKEDIENEGQVEKRKRRKSKSTESDRQILGTKENKKDKGKEKDKDLSWKKPSKKEKIYREGKRRSKERGRSKSKDRRKSKSLSPKKDKKKNKDRKKKSERKKDIERYDVRKIVKNKEIRKTDAFGRDILSKSRSISRSRSRSPVRERSRNMLRRDSRSYTRSRSRSYRRGRSPIRRRYLRSRTKSRSKSLRRSFSRSRSRSRSPRKSKKKFKSKDRLKGRSRSRGRKSRSRRRSLTRSRSRSPLPRMARGKRPRSRRSWSHHSRSLSFSPRRSRSISRSPVRMRRSYSRSVSSSWSRGRSPIPRASSLEKLMVVLKRKDKKKGKKKKEGKKAKREEDRRKKLGNTKEVFASGDNVLVSVNFRNNNIASSNNNNGSASNDTTRTRLDSMSPTASSDRKRKRGHDYEVEKVSKKPKKSHAISRNIVDVGLSNSCTKRAKKLTRLSEKDAEVILNRKPVAVIDLDMSPYREQTPSPINVVVVSDSGSGDEGKEQSPQRPNAHASSSFEPEKSQENADTQSATVSVSGSPVANGYLTGPKTPPEPQIKFSIAKPPQLRQIANPLGNDDDDEDDDGDDDDDQEFKRIESLDRRIEKELDASHKGPNTPPEPRGPTTPKTPPSPQTSPDAYDPFEPTKSRSPTPTQNKDTEQDSPAEQDTDQPIALTSEASSVAPATDADKVASDIDADIQDDKKAEVCDKGDNLPSVDSVTAAATTAQSVCTPVSEPRKEDSPERKTAVPPTTGSSALTAASGPATPFAPFSVPSPTKTTRTAIATAAQPIQISGIQRLQHRLGSPVNRTPNSVKTTPEKRATPRTESSDVVPPGNYRATAKRNGEQAKQARSMQDATNETTVDAMADMEDSPYSPASSEGDDLFDPPLEPTKPSQTNPKAVQPGYKPPASKTPHKSPIKQLSKFDLLFGPSGPTLSPLKVANKKPKPNPKPGVPAKSSNMKPSTTAPSIKKNSGKRGISLKMDEDQLRILDELPSSAVELQVKDKFLKKLNRQERVVDEVKTVLKPHYAKKHITKEEYKDILRRSVPKICHSRSGEINPSKIQSLIEAYVRKFRHAKKKGSGNSVAKAKVK